MVESCVGPSELHLKKELTLLRKARYLRDPETCSSWRSSLTSRSLAGASVLNCNNGSGNSNGILQAGGLHKQPLRRDKKRNVYLYNWTSKSSDVGPKLNKELQESVDGSPDMSISPQTNNSHSEVPTKIRSMRCNNPQSSVRRTVRRPKRNPISRTRLIKHLVSSKLHETQSTSLVVNLVEQSDNTEYCESTDVAGKGGYPASPVSSRYGCGNWSCSSSMLRSFKREESSHSYTPASTSSYNICGPHNTSAFDSCDGTAPSLDGDEPDDPDLPGCEGCGVPCYWSKGKQDKGLGGACSPSLSDSLKRRGSSLLCGTQTLYNKKRGSNSYKAKYVSKSSQGLPLLYNSCDIGGLSLEKGSDNLSTNFGELDLEALSRLDGGRWSSCKSEEGRELALLGRCDIEELDNRSLTQKYRPKSFDDIVGQTIVVQSLRNAVSRGRIAPAYLFQGPRGTGKTSAARIFARALNCTSTEENKPCGFCNECVGCSKGNNTNIREVDAANQKAIERIRYYLENITATSPFSRYKVFIFDESHMLLAKMWSSFMKFLEELPPRLVFIFLTVDPDNMPRTVVSRCQKYLFSKIKDGDIVSRLRKISAEENLDIDLEALDLIAINSDGSLRDAETMLDQLSLLGRKITTSLVNDLVGGVSDEKLLDLLEIALSSDTAETVKRSRDLMASGVDPMALMSQLAAVIMNIIAGTYRTSNLQSSRRVLGERSLTDVELERLQNALKVLSDAEKQIRLSSERSTWFTAALLQLGNSVMLEPNRSSSSSNQSTCRVNDVASDRAKESPFLVNNSHLFQTRLKSNTVLIPGTANNSSGPHLGQSSQLCVISHNTSQPADRKLIFEAIQHSANGTRIRHYLNPEMDEIWKRCIEGCHSKTLKELLYTHGKLVSITETEGSLVAFIAFDDANIKSRVERFLSSLTSSIEMVLRKNVEVRVGFLPENYMESYSSSSREQQKEESLNILSHMDRDGVISNLTSKSLEYSERGRQRMQEKCDNSKEQMVDQRFQIPCNPVFTEGSNPQINSENCFSEVVPAQPCIAPVDEQRLEDAWLQNAENSIAGPASHLKLEKNQVWPQNGVSFRTENESFKLQANLPKDLGNELDNRIANLEITDGQSHKMNQNGGRLDHLAISPSLLHRSSLAVCVDKDNMGYESGSGCNGLFCWNTRKPCRRNVKQGSIPGLSRRNTRRSLFGECGKLRTSDRRFRK